MSDIHYTLNPVEEKPERSPPRPRGSSKYAPILEAFLGSGHRLVLVDGTGKDANYLCGQLKKVCKQRDIKSVK